MQPENQNRVTTALEIEALARSRDMNEINEASRSAEPEVVRDFAERGMLRSGGFGESIAAIHRDRARQMVDRQIAQRGESLKKVPELGTKEHFKSLLDSVHSTIEGVFRSIPEHLRNRGAQVAHDAIHKKSEFECVNLKTHAQRKIEILRREHELERAKQEDPMAPLEGGDKRKVWVVHGRNLKARDAMFAFLRAIGLKPMEWGEALALTGKGTP